MKTPVATLTGDLLNYAVALAEKYEPRCSWMLAQQGYTAWQQYEHAHGNPVPAYLTSSAGDDIIDREKISVSWTGKAWLGATLVEPDPGYCRFGHKHYAATRREAAMRCYVASKFGDEIELPRMNCTPPNEQI